MRINEHLVTLSIIYDGPHSCVNDTFKSDTVFLSNLLRIQVQPHYLHRILSYWNAQSAPSLQYFTQSPNTHYPFVKFLKEHVCRVYVAFTKIFFSRESVISTHYSCGVSANTQRPMNLFRSCHYVENFNTTTLETLVQLFKSFL